MDRFFLLLLSHVSFCIKHKLQNIYQELGFDTIEDRFKQDSTLWGEVFK